METTIEQIINDYGLLLWKSFITLVVTSFALLSVKNLVQDLIYYFKARFSDIGYGQVIIWQDSKYVVQSIKFKHIIVTDENVLMRIPIKLFFDSPIIFPNRRRITDH
jgi:hypothetical protein